MEVTRVVIQNYKPVEFGVCASARITLDDVLVIHQIQIVNGKKGLFVAYPNGGNTYLVDKESKKRKFRDIVHPCNEELREHITDKVLEAYHNFSG